jgi:hypothetical protein
LAVARRWASEASVGFTCKAIYGAGPLAGTTARMATLARIRRSEIPCRAETLIAHFRSPNITCQALVSPGAKASRTLSVAYKGRAVTWIWVRVVS